MITTKEDYVKHETEANLLLAPEWRAEVSDDEPVGLDIEFIYNDNTFFDLYVNQDGLWEFTKIEKGYCVLTGTAASLPEIIKMMGASKENNPDNDNQ